MSRFERAIEYVLDNEGGLTRCDPGGITKYGISKRAYPDLDIESLTREQAKEIYRRDYWEVAYDLIPDERLATKLFDHAVNIGNKMANKLLQRAVNELRPGALKEDGIIGPKTLTVVSLLDIGKLYFELKIQLFLYYTELKDWKRYAKGWARRILRDP